MDSNDPETTAPVAAETLEARLLRMGLVQPEGNASQAVRRIQKVGMTKRACYNKNKDNKNELIDISL